MRLIKSNFLFMVPIFIGLVFVLLPTVRAHAADDSASTCSIMQTDIDAIHAIQIDPTLSYSVEITKELAARKALLNRVIACAQNEVESLQQGLQAVSPADASVRSIQSGLAGQLNDVTNYYGIEQGKVAGVGLNGSQQIAKDLLDWRSSDLLPLEARISGFIVWSRNQALFDAAVVRMTQAGRVVSFLSSTNNADLASAYYSAQTSFREAQTENVAAENALAQSQQADQVALLVQQSLKSLADTYQGLFTVGNIVQGLAPQGD
jgi:hypothetical protein